MRSREWRRRIGGACTPGQTFSGTIDASADDGFVNQLPEFNNTAQEVIAGHWSAGGRAATNTWIRYINATIPAGARIDACTMDVTVKWAGSDGTGVKTNIYFNAIDDAVNPTTKAEMDALARTTNFAAWDDEDLGPYPSPAVTSPDFSSALQEVVDRGGWVSGQAIMVLWDDDGSSADKRYVPWAFDGSGQDITLDVEYCA